MNALLRQKVARLKSLAIDTSFYAFVFTLLFSFGALYMVYYYSNYYLFALPVLLVLFLLAFKALNKLYFLLIFLVPFSVPLRRFITGTDVDLALPTEPIVVGMMLIIIMKMLLEKNIVDKRIIWHPVSLVIYFNLLWIFVTSMSSSMPLVSFKFFLSRTWYVFVFYFFAVILFRNASNIRRFIWLYAVAFLFVILYASGRMIALGVNDGNAHLLMNPFFNDHTIYGAMVAFFIPLLFGLLFLNRRNQALFVVILGMLIAYFVGLYWSYARAAWLSVAAALGILTLIYFRIKFRTVVLVLGALVFTFFTFKNEILNQLAKNDQDSSKNVVDHIRSMTNIATDASNVERINRWYCALQMFAERPVFGWGPGTYSFQYAPFQKEQFKTIISTNFGDVGNAHSEYMGPLAESGVFGLLSMIALAVVTLSYAARIYYRSGERSIKILSMSIMLALVTYYVHGFLNNFLDTDKASAPFWGCIAALVALDLYHTEAQKASRKPEADKDQIQV